jgi:hypothetical protein
VNLKLFGESTMTALQTVDFLADIQFIDYQDAEFLLKNEADVNSLADIQLTDIQFIDYWDAEFALNGLDFDVSRFNGNADISLDGWDADISFE